MSWAGGALSAAVGAVVLLGWALGLTALTSIHPSLSSMKVNAAAGFVLAGLALCLLREERRSVLARHVARVCAAVLVLIGVLVLSEYLLGRDWGIDQLFVKDTRATGASFPGRAAPTTALDFMLIGIALLLIDFETPRGRRPAPWLALSAGIVTIFVLVAQAYDVQAFLGVGKLSQVALHTTWTTLVLCAGLVFARPQHGPMAIVTSATHSGALARRMLPATLVLPLLLGGLVLLGQLAGIYGVGVRMALIVASQIVVLSALIWWAASSLLRAEEEQMHTAERVRQSEQSLSMTLESIADAVIATDNFGRIVRMNPVAERLTGHSLSDAKGKPLDEVFQIRNEETNATVESPVDKVLREGIVVGLANHTVLLAADGRRTPIADSAAPIRTQDGEVSGVVMIFRDQTAERRAEARLIAFLDGAPDAMLVTDDKGRIVTNNRQCERLLGYAAEDLIGQEIEILMPERTRAVHHAHRARYAAQPHAGLMGGNRYVARRKDGVEIPIEISLNHIQSEDGPQVVVALRDLTERRRFETEQARSDEKFHTLFESSSDAVMLLDENGFFDCNGATLRLFGVLTKEEFCSTHPADLSPARQPDGTDSRTLATKQMTTVVAEGSLAFEWMHSRVDTGAEFPTEVLLSRMYLDGRPVLQATVRDITARRKLEESLRQSEEQLRQAQKMDAVGRLAGGIAHDFNNLLSVILSYANLTTDSLSPGDPLREDIQEITKAGQRAADLTGQLLAFSRQTVLQPKVIDLSDSIAKMEKMLRRVLGEDIELKTIRATPSWKVKADPGQVEQVVMNLAVNARDAMPDGGKLTIETGNVELDESYAREHLGTKAGPHVMLAVSDTGIGMDKEMRSRIFEPFYTTKAVGKGTGLGLSTVFGVVQQSGGSIWVYSEPGQGTTFKVYFPRAEESARPVAAGSSVAPMRRGTETVLLVEDEEQLRRLADGVLRRHGYAVLAAASPAEALGLSEQHEGKIDLLLTDVVMPGMNGRQLADRLAKSRPEMRVLYMSGYTGNVVVHHGVLDEGVAFLQKPITPEMLLRALRDVLDGPSPPA